MHWPDEHGSVGAGFGFEEEAAASGAQVKDFEDGNENNAEGGRAIGRHKAGLHYFKGDQNQRDNRAGEAEVKAGIEKMLLVLEQAQLDARWDFLASDFGKLHEAGDIKEALQHEEEQQR